MNEKLREAFGFVTCEIIGAPKPKSVRLAWKDGEPVGYRDEWRIYQACHKHLIAELTSEEMVEVVARVVDPYGFLPNSTHEMHDNTSLKKKKRREKAIGIAKTALQAAKQALSEQLDTAKQFESAAAKKLGEE